MIFQIKKVGSAIKAELQSTRFRGDSIDFFFDKNKVQLKEVALFGGAVRDIFLFGQISENSDLDFVVSCSKSVLREIISEFNPVENKFGGFRFKFGGRNIDIWSLSETWAIKKGYVENNDGMMDLLRTTFFNVDSAYYRLYDNSLICSKRFKDGIEKMQLGVNLFENPSPKNIAGRIKRMESEKNLSLDSEMRKYLERHISAAPDEKANR